MGGGMGGGIPQIYEKISSAKSTMTSLLLVVQQFRNDFRVLVTIPSTLQIMVSKIVTDLSVLKRITNGILVLIPVSRREREEGGGRRRRRTEGDGREKGGGQWEGRGGRRGERDRGGEGGGRETLSLYQPSQSSVKSLISEVGGRRDRRRKRRTEGEGRGGRRRGKMKGRGGEGKSLSLCQPGQSSVKSCISSVGEGEGEGRGGRREKKEERGKREEEGGGRRGV
jgi:hypothetical protein